MDAPGCGKSVNQGTFVTAISSAGVIVGYCVDSVRKSQGFVRNVDGSISEFGIKSADVTPTAVADTDQGSVVVGNYSVNRTHNAFIRFPDGTIQILKDKGSPIISAEAVSPSLAVTGSIANKQLNLHGYVWGP